MYECWKRQSRRYLLHGGRRLRMRNDIHGNHKHLATVVLFLKYKCATSYNNHIRRWPPIKHNTLPVRNDIHGNHKRSGTVVLFLKYKCATSYNSHIRRWPPTGRNPLRMRMETTRIWLRLFYSSSVSVSLRTTTTSGYNHQHDRTPCASVMIFMETTSIWLLLFYSSSVSVPLLTTTTFGPQEELQQKELRTLNWWREHDFYPRPTSMQSSR